MKCVNFGQTKRIEQLSNSIASAATVAETAKKIVEGNMERFFTLEQGLKTFDSQRQAQMSTTSMLGGRITHLETQIAQVQGPTAQRPPQKATEPGT